MTGRRRGQGEGSIYRRSDGRWVAVLDLGWRDGKRTRKYFYGRTREQVARKLARGLAQHQQGYEFANEQLTVEQFLGRWLEAKQGTVRSGTWTRYEELVRLHVNPRIGKRRLARLKPEQLQQFYSELQASRSPATLLKVHRMLHSAFKLAVRWGAMPQNVTELVLAPPTRQRHEFTRSRQSRRAVPQGGPRRPAGSAVCAGHHHRDAPGRAARAALAGRGPGAPPAAAGPAAQDPPVTPGGGAAGAPATALVDHRDRQAAERERQGAGWEEHGLVFPNTVGRPLDPHNLRSRSFFPLLARAGLPRLRFHDCVIAAPRCC